MDLFPNAPGQRGVQSARNPQGVEPVPGRRRNTLRSLARAPARAFGWDQITRNAQLIRELAENLRQGPPPERPLLQQPDGTLDVRATAFSLGLPEIELRQRLAAWRRQSARAANASVAMGLLIVGLWAWRAATGAWTVGWFVTSLQFGPFCAIFFLAGFKYAWLNWQLRTGRLGSAGDYLRSAEPFWPR